MSEQHGLGWDWAIQQVCWISSDGRTTSKSVSGSGCGSGGWIRNLGKHLTISSQLTCNTNPYQNFEMLGLKLCEKEEAVVAVVVVVLGLRKQQQ